MATARCKILGAWKPCGCLSHCMLVDGDTTAWDVAEFWAKCLERGIDGREVQAGEELPAWECEVHERARMARRKGGA